MKHEFLMKVKDHFADIAQLIKDYNMEDWDSCCIHIGILDPLDEIILFDGNIRHEHRQQRRAFEQPSSCDAEETTQISTSSSGLKGHHLTKMEDLLEKLWSEETPRMVMAYYIGMSAALARRPYCWMKTFFRYNKMRYLIYIRNSKGQSLESD